MNPGTSSLGEALKELQSSTISAQGGWRTSGACVGEPCEWKRCDKACVMELVKNQGASFYNSNHGSTAFQILQNDTLVMDICTC